MVFTPHRFVLWLGVGIFTVLAIMATLFYQERMIFSDMAFQSFHIIRTGNLQVQSGRFGAVGTQFFPWITTNAGLPLKAVLLSYSIGHVLYYFLLFLFTHLVLRQWRWAAAIALTAVFMTTHTFYWLSEAPQGLAFLLVLLAWTDTKNSLREIKIWQWPLWIAGVVTAFYFHPMVMYAMVFCTGFMILTAPEKQKKMVWAVGLLLLLLTFILKYKILKLDWYDAMSLSRAEAFGNLWPNWLNIKSNRDFWQWCGRDYYLIPIAYAVNIISFLRSKKWLLALWCLLFTPAYILLVNIPFYEGDRQFYLENLYLPLGIFAVVPWLWQIFPKVSDAPLRLTRIYPSIIFLAVLRLFHIYQTHQPWTARLEWEKKLLRDHPAPKFLVKEQDLPTDLLQFTWGLPYESLLLTSLPSPDSSRTVFQYREMTPKLDSLTQQTDLFLGTFKHYKQDSLPGRYFHLKPVKYTE